MKAKTLWRIAVTTTLEAEEAVAELLAELLGQGASSYYDLELQTSQVSVYLQQPGAPDSGLRQQIRAGLARMKECGLAAGPAKIAINRVPPENWEESWKRHFKPIEIGRTLLIKPSWSRRRPKKDQAVVVLDPGLSFGTGQHPTTSYCLAEVASHAGIDSVRSFLDIGTGSGILAIAAARLHYQPIFAFDFDPESVRVARANVENNQVRKNLHLSRGDATRLPLRPARRFDLVCANLISNLLVAERKRIIAQLNQGGTLVLAGILKSEFALVRAAYAELGWRLVKSVRLNEWESGSFRFQKKG